MFLSKTLKSNYYKLLQLNRASQSWQLLSYDKVVINKMMRLMSSQPKKIAEQIKDIKHQNTKQAYEIKNNK